MADIYKAAGIIIRDKKLLVSRTGGKIDFFSPGGKLQGDETPAQALIRELNEELSIVCSETDLELFGIYNATAARDNPGMTVEMTVYIVKNYTGELTASSEIEELRWITSEDENDPLIGSIFAHEVIPKLKEQGLIL